MYHKLENKMIIQEITDYLTNLTDFLLSRSDVGQIELKNTNEIYPVIDTYHLKSSPFPPVPKFNRSLSLAYFVILIFCVNEVANRISPFSSSVWDLLSDSQLVSTQLNQYVYMYVASFMI